MQYDDVGCSSMFQLTHSASSINSDASDRSSKSGTVRPLTSLQPLNPSTCPSSKVKLEKKPNNLPKRHGCICNGSHLPTGFSFSSASNYFLHFSAVGEQPDLAEHLRRADAAVCHQQDREQVLRLQFLSDPCVCTWGPIFGSWCL